MRLRSSRGGVKVSTLPCKPEVSGSIPETELRFLFIFVVFTLCLPCYSDCKAPVHLSVVLRPRSRALSQKTTFIGQSSPALHIR